MLHFQHAKHKQLSFFRRRHLFLGQLFLVSCVFHLLVLFFLFVLYNGYRYSTNLVFRPVEVQIMSVDSGSSVCAQPVARSIVQSVEHKVKQETEKKEKVAKAATTLKDHAPAKSVAKPKQEPQKAIAKEQPQQQKLQQKQTKPAENKQKQQPVTIAKNPPLKKALPKPQQKKQPIESVADFDTPHIQQYIQKELSKHWNPPIGLPEDVVCAIALKVGIDGVVTDAVIKESSGILVYDLSARSAAASLSLPRWAWGKEFTISFNQG